MQRGQKKPLHHLSGTADTFSGYPLPLPPSGEGTQGSREAGHRREWALREHKPTSEPAPLSWRWLLSQAPQAPTGAISKCGRGFHSGSPQGVRLGLRQGARAGGPFLLCPGTLGLCSQPALSEDGTRTMGRGRTWLRVPTPLGGILSQQGEGAEEGIESHFWAQHPLGEPSSPRYRGLT